MEVSLDTIERKPDDFKICKKCKNINWYENETCHICNGKDFDELGKGVLEFIKHEHYFYGSEGWEDDEIDNIRVEV